MRAFFTFRQRRPDSPLCPAEKNPHSKGTGPRLVAALFLVFFIFPVAGQASGAQAATTMPLGAVKADAPKRGTASGKEKTASASRAAAASSKEKAANGLKKSAGIKGFSSNPFQLDHKKNGTKKTKPDLNRAIYGDKQKDVKPLSLGSDKKVTLSGKGASPPPDRMTPDRRVFSGGEHTLSRVDDDPPPEVTLRYSLNKNATTSLVINPQDEASPLPRPAEANRDLNAAGVYVNVDVAPDVKLRVGGEYCTIDDSGAGKSENSHGAAVGLEWSF